MVGSRKVENPQKIIPGNLAFLKTPFIPTVAV